MFCKYECGYGMEDRHKDPNHMKSIKRVVWPNFPIKRLYTWPDVVEITFYHWTHTQTNGNLAHNAYDLGSTSQMLMYAPCMFHKLKEFIWTQLRLGYTVKKNYDKHKKIWWAWPNVGE